MGNTSVAMNYVYIIGFLLLAAVGILFILPDNTPTIPDVIPTLAIAPSSETVDLFVDKLESLYNEYKALKEQWSRSRDDLERAALGIKMEEKRKELEAVATWLESNGVALDRLSGRMICAWCNKDLGHSWIDEDSHGICKQCMADTLGE